MPCFSATVPSSLSCSYCDDDVEGWASSVVGVGAPGVTLGTEGAHDL